MDLNRLRYFLAVAEELHFGRAAQRLHMAQPPLSRQIRALEDDLGVRLFHRNTRTVELTEAGRLVLPQVQRLIVDAAALERRVEQYRNGEGGTLRLGFVDSSSYDVMPALLRAYRRRWPSVEYELTSMSSDEQHRALRAGEIDLGLGRAAGGDGIHSELVKRERLVIATNADHPLAHLDGTSLSQLHDETFIGFDRRVSPSLHAEMHRMFALRGIGYDPVIEATEYTTVLGLVAAGQGIAIVPAGVQTFRPDRLNFIPLADDDATSALLVLTREGDRSALVERAVEAAGQLFQTSVAR